MSQEEILAILIVGIFYIAVIIGAFYIHWLLGIIVFIWIIFKK